MTEDVEVQASPVVRVARDLTEICNMSVTLDDQALHKANDRLMPGGRAMVALADVASPATWERRIELTEHAWVEADAVAHVDGWGVRRGKSGPTPHVADEDDEWEPPLQTLLFWSEAWRAEHNALYDQRPTIASEANFIRWALNWAWDNELHWDDFAADINRIRLRLENLLYAGNRVERTRVPCTNVACERPARLIKVYANHAKYDHYKCPGCKNRYEQKDFARAKLQHLTAQGADRHVKMQDARDAIDRPERTWRKWLRLWYVRSYRDPRTGQVWVWWPDVRDADRTTPRRRRVDAA